MEQILDALYVATKFSLLFGFPQICINPNEARLLTGFRQQFGSLTRDGHGS